MQYSLMTELGLRPCSRFLADRLFYLAMLSTLPVLSVMGLLVPGRGRRLDLPVSVLFFYLLWQPLLEELLFRGVVQGQLRRMAWARKMFFGLSLANLVTSLLFVLTHLASQPVLWALSVFFPSLVFGFFRDRHAQIYPGLILHSTYNGFFLLTVAWLR